MISLLDHLILIAVSIGALAFTLFVPVYAWWAHRLWWRAPAGVALMVSSTATALLLDLTLLFRVWEPPIVAGLWITLAVVALIALGGWLKVAALAIEMRHGRHRAPPSPADH